VVFVLLGCARGLLSCPTCRLLMFLAIYIHFLILDGQTTITIYSAFKWSALQPLDRRRSRTFFPDIRSALTSLLTSHATDKKATGGRLITAAVR
jgi:hypothetical protein